MVSGVPKEHVFHVPEGTEGPCTQPVCVPGTKQGCISLLPIPAHLWAWLLPLSFIASYCLKMCSDCINLMFPLHFWNMNMHILCNIRKGIRVGNNKSFFLLFLNFQVETTVTIFCTMFWRRKAHSHAVCACCKCHLGYLFFHSHCILEILQVKCFTPKKQRICVKEIWSFNGHEITLFYTVLFSYLMAFSSYSEL